jgi:hypothetical protein
LAQNPVPRRDERRSVHRLMVAALLLTLVFGVVHARTEDNWDLKRYPVAAYDELLARHLESGRLLTTDAWAGYVIARDRQPVFFDDRYDMYPLAVTNDYDAVLDVHPDWEARIDKYHVDVIMWPKSSPLVQVLDARPGWQQIYHDKSAVLYVRRAPAQP